MNRIKTSVLACSVVCLGVGCSSDGDVNVGDGTPVNIDKSKLEAYAGSWDGYVEAYTFPSGTDRVRVVLDVNGNGHLQVGDGALAPPPADPDVSYPDALRAYYTQHPPMESPFPNLWDGLDYPVAGARTESERIRFSIDPVAAPGFKQWCELQTSIAYVADVNPTYYTSCPHMGHYQTETGCTYSPDMGQTELPVDCGRLVLCSACACTESSCTISSAPLMVDNVVVAQAYLPLGTYSMPLDAALSDDGHDLVGTFMVHDPTGLTEFVARTIRLKR
jgi:hypothetical protein